MFPLEQSVLNLGAGYRLNDRYALSFNYGRTLHVAFGHDIKNALGFGISRSF